LRELRQRSSRKLSLDKKLAHLKTLQWMRSLAPIPAVNNKTEPFLRVIQTLGSRIEPRLTLYEDLANLRYVRWAQAIITLADSEQ
jgi:hypothetical protein